MNGLSGVAVSHVYDSKFMDYADVSSRYSAKTIVRILREVLPIESVLDIGCAKGTWLDAWRASGVDRIHGADGDYVDIDRLVVPRESFTKADISEPLTLGGCFDLVQSLEVAEHISTKCSDCFIENLVSHSNGIVLFSAASPGQGGEFHINEQPYEYWRQKFRELGFEPFDYIRPQIAADSAVSFWYRYNIILYVRRDRIMTLPMLVAKSRVDDRNRIPDISPGIFRLRKAVVRVLPMQWRHKMARLKAAVFGRRSS